MVQRFQYGTIASEVIVGFGDRNTSFLAVPALVLRVGMPPVNLKLARSYMKGPS